MCAQNIADRFATIIYFNQEIQKIERNWGVDDLLTPRNEYTVKGPPHLSKTVYGNKNLYKQLELICISLGIDTYAKEVLPPKWLNRAAFERWNELKKQGRVKKTGKSIEKFGNSIKIHGTTLEKPIYTKQIIFFINYTANGRLNVEPLYYFDDTRYADPIKIKALRDWNHSIWNLVEFNKNAPSKAIHELTKRYI